MPRIALQRCKENNITISQKKLELSNKIKFPGHVISDEGYGPDNDKFTAIAKFPQPKNLRDLRGFIGLANQLGMFIPDLAHMTSFTLPTHEKRCCLVMTTRTQRSIHEDEGAAHLDIISQAIRRDKRNTGANRREQIIWPRICTHSEIPGRK